MISEQYAEYLKKTTNKEPIENYEFMNVEYLRLTTFVTWTSEHASTTKLAKAGLFYRGHGDEVHCFSCRGMLKDWVLGISIEHKHREAYPLCEFVRGTDRQNVPITAVLLSTNLGQRQALYEALDRMSIKRGLLENILEGTADQGSNSDSVRINLTDLTPRRSSHETRTTPSRNDLISQNSPTVPNREVDWTGVGNHPIRNQQNTIYRNRPSGSANNVTDTERWAYLREEARLDTFSNIWPSNNPMCPEDLARAGFYFTHISDRVQCAFCFGVLRNWEEGDDAMGEHQRYFPNCPFVRGEDVRNEPIDRTRSPEGVRLGIPSASVETSDTLGVVTQRPKRPELAIESKRHETFQRWPTQIIQSAAEMVAAGFYYTGHADNVKCFYCDGGLRNWERDDDVWVAHARWFPKCGFVRNVKGEAFIEEVKGQYPKEPEVTNSLPAERGDGTGSSSNVAGDTLLQKHMKSTAVRAVLDMGYPRELVAEAVGRKLRDTGDAFGNAKTLLDCLFKMEELERSETDRKGGNKERKQGFSASAKSSDGANADTEKPASKDLLEEITSLREENERIRDERLCKICFESDATIAFLPCGHLVTCSKCSAAVRSCPICRKTIKGTVKTILS